MPTDSKEEKNLYDYVNKTENRNRTAGDNRGGRETGHRRNDRADDEIVESCNFVKALK